MESKLAREARQALLAESQLLTPEERLNAFLEHCQLMMALYEAGQKLRSGALVAEPTIDLQCSQHSEARYDYLI